LLEEAKLVSQNLQAHQRIGNTQVFVYWRPEFRHGRPPHSHPLHQRLRFCIPVQQIGAGRSFMVVGSSPPATPATKSPKKKQDRRRKRFRKHGGIFREPPNINLDDIPPDQVIHHDVRVDECPCCSGKRLRGTVDIPEPKPEFHRFRRRESECLDRHCH
jgi:hypothetical protein